MRPVLGAAVVKQSDERVAGRSGAPPSFGRANVEPPEPEKFRVVGGEAFMTLHVDVVPSEESLARLYARIRHTTEQALRDAYAHVVGEALPEPPPGVDGGTPGG